MIPLQNDAFLVGLENYNGEFYLINFAADNSIIWKKKYTIPNYYGNYYHHQMIPDGNGGIYLMISTNMNLTLLKIDSLGDIEWSKEYIGPVSSGKSPGFSICKTQDNGVMATMKDGSNQCVFKLNTLGLVQWSKSFMDMNYRWPTSIRATDDGNYIVSGFLNGDQPYLHKITPAGEFLFAKTYGDNSQNFELFDTKEHTNGNFYMIVSDYQSLGLMEIDQNGNHNTTKTIEGVYANYYTKFNTNEYDLPFIVNSIDNSFHSRIDFDGNMDSLCKISSTIIMNSNDDTLITESLILTDLYVNNLSVTVTEDVAFEILLGYDVTARGFCNYVVDLEEFDQKYLPKIFPNPAVDYININANGGVISLIKLYDLQGRCILNQTFELNGATQIDVSNLNSGSYRLLMIIDGELLNKQVIIQK